MSSFSDIKIQSDSPDQMLVINRLTETFLDGATRTVAQNGKAFCQFKEVKSVEAHEDERFGDEDLPDGQLAVLIVLTRWKRLRVAVTCDLVTANATVESIGRFLGIETTPLKERRSGLFSVQSINQGPPSIPER